MNTKGVNIDLLLDNWWGKKSVLLHKDCFLYKLKNKFIEELLELQYINKSDMDRRNETPHIQITDDRHAKNEGAFNKLNNSVVFLSLDKFLFHKEHIEVETGDSGVLLQTHMTLIFKKGGYDKDKFMSVLHHVFNTLTKEFPKEWELTNDSPKESPKKHPINHLTALHFENKTVHHHMDEKCMLEYNYYLDALRLVEEKKHYKANLKKLYNAVFPNTNNSDEAYTAEELVEYCEKAFRDKFEVVKLENIYKKIEATEAKKKACDEEIIKLQQMLNSSS
jgi:hypothetical protein